MATYTFRCAADGPVDVAMPMGTAPATIGCPRCGDPAARVYTAPRLGLADRGRMAVLDHTESTRSAPAVVSALPGRPRPAPARLDPRTRALPRP